MKEYFAKLKYLFKWRDVAFALVIFAIALVFAIFSGENMMDVVFGENAVDVVTDQYTMNIPYDLVDSIEMATYSKDDENVDGKSDMVLRSGIWKSEAWGEYYACLDLQTDTCIVVHLTDGRVFVFSHESDKTVAEEFETFQSRLEVATVPAA